MTPLLPRRRDRFGLRPLGRFPPDLFRAIAARIARLGEERETPEARAALETVLAGPYWGLRVLAVRAVAGWGGRRNKAWLMGLAARPTALRPPEDRAARWQELETLTARAALALLLSPEDGPWLIEAWFAGGGRRFEGLSARLGLMPDRLLRERIGAAMASGDPAARMAILHLAAWRATLPDRAEILSALAADPDPALARYAAILLPRVAPAEEPPAPPRRRPRRPPRTGHPPGRL